MGRIPRYSRGKWLGRLLLPVTCAALLLSSAFAQAPPFQEPGGPALPQDEGAAGLEQALRKLGHTERLLHIVAHPDDEDGGLLTLMARGRGATVMLLSLTRGEGGQNVTGSGLSDELGVLRTLELLASCRYYGVALRFTRAADFGYSKSAEETLKNWPRDVVLADIVRVIREFRPDVILSGFSGTPRDGHGQHQVSGILAREAFRAAADPDQFPEQLKQGLQPWQARKFYIRRRGGDDWTIRVETSVNDPALGKMYSEFAREGLRHQRSQGSFQWRFGPPPHYSHYALVDSVLPNLPPGTKEQDFFEGIDTSLGSEAEDSNLDAIVTAVKKATDPAAPRAAVAEALLDGLAASERALKGLTQGTPSMAPSGGRASAPERSKAESERALRRVPDTDLADLIKDLEVKRDQFRGAARLATGVALQFRLDSESPLLIPSRWFQGKVSFEANQGMALRDLTLETSFDHRIGDRREGVTAVAISPKDDAALTRPYWYRGDSERDFVHQVYDAACLTRPFCPPELLVHAGYSYGTGGADVAAAALAATSPSRWAMVAPPVSLEFVPASLVIPASRQQPTPLAVKVRWMQPALLAGDQRHKVHMRVLPPPGGQLVPGKVPFERDNNEFAAEFRLAPNLAEGRHEIRAVAEFGGRTYSDSFTLVQRDDLGAYPYVHPATQRVSVVDVKTPADLKIAYVMGSGDDIPDVLTQLGLSVIRLTPGELGQRDLSAFSTIVLGIRAYETHAGLKPLNQRLLDYVLAGGTLVVQYNADTGPFPYAPFPVEIGRERVSVEDAPVEILKPEDPLLNFPNRITGADFNGWVQERGLYFATQWDPRFQPLLASSDPGEPPLPGGLLRARHGKGTYILTSYSFFRQLPAGVPGAIRLFVNLVSAGHEPR